MGKTGKDYTKNLINNNPDLTPEEKHRMLSEANKKGTETKRRKKAFKERFINFAMMDATKFNLSLIKANGVDFDALGNNPDNYDAFMVGLFKSAAEGNPQASKLVMQYMCEFDMLPGQQNTNPILDALKASGNSQINGDLYEE